MAMDRHEHRELSEARDAAGRAENKQNELKAEVRMLQDKVTSLSAACQALWELLREKSSLTEDDLAARIQQVSAKMGEPLACPSCGRATSRKRNRCLFCGIDAKSTMIFDT